MIYRLVLSALFLTALGGCEATSGLNPAWYHNYQDYLTKSHYRAFAVTGGTSEALASSVGRSWGYGTVEGAIEGALVGCRKGGKKYIKIRECRIYAVGDIKVAGMSEEQLDKVISFYENNLNATKEGYSYESLLYGFMGIAP